MKLFNFYEPKNILPQMPIPSYLYNPDFRCWKDRFVYFFILLRWLFVRAFLIK